MTLLTLLYEFWDFLVIRRAEICKLIFEHVELTIFSVAIAIAVGIPLGILITRVKKLAGPVIGIANVIQAIPSLALVGFLIPVLGIGSKPAVIMVFLYSLLPIVKNTYIGLLNINPNTIEAAKGMGMTGRQILKMIQLPLALPVIMTGIRISAVTAVGLMTIAAFVGAGGLGYMVFSGVQTVNNKMILAGAIPACVLALLMDYILAKIENAVTPSGIKKADGTIKISKHRRKLNRRSYTKWVASALCITLIAVTVIICGKKNNSIVVGSKNANEQMILSNMIATMLEENTNLNVERKLNLGGSSVTFNAIKSGELDMYVEYTGTALVNIMKRKPENDIDKAFDIVKNYFDKEYQITWLEPFGFNNTYTLAVKKDLADKYNLNSFSDLSKISDQLVLGCSIEFANREDGYLGVQKKYGMNFKDVKGVDGGLRYTSIDNNKTDVIDAFSTDGLLKVFQLKVLEDDKQFFPSYYGVPIVRNDVIKKHPEIVEVLNRLAGTITDETMRELNYKVDKLGMPPRQVADDFLRSQGLIK